MMDMEYLLLSHRLDCFKAKRKCSVGAAFGDTSERCDGAA